MYSTLSSGALLALGLFGANAVAKCVSYGMDFQDKGSYFQNSLSTDPFTFVSQFEGCEDDSAQNIFVDPNGDEHQCTDTPLTPDDTNQLSTCPLNKNQLWSGDWSIVIISNNGESGDPIAYERDFSLSVGTQSTTTFTPTVTASAVVTPVKNVTSTTTDTVTTTLKPSTVTKPSTTVKPTTTITPAAVTSTKTINLLTLHPTVWTVSVVKSTVTKTASCKAPTRQPFVDPIATITPTLVAAAALSSNGASVSVSVGLKPKRRVLDRRVPVDAQERIAKRKAAIAARRAALEAKIEKRAPDQPTVTVTDTNTADYVTTTTTSTAATTTVTVYASVTTTSTVTPAPVTVVSGKTVASAVTITAPTPTKTKTRIAIATSWTTRTLTQTVKITTEVTPSPTASHCRAIGGTLI
ncbi:MAG: hypothetical protein M1820_000303 [Bogoriella megaspora]|nr:MAG: hypothetical protein M1820_000303 [Bogoriella megaspora]